MRVCVVIRGFRVCESTCVAHTQRSLSIKKKANSWESARGLVILLLSDIFFSYVRLHLVACGVSLRRLFFFSTRRVYVCAGHSCATDECVRMSRWLAKIYMDTNRSFILKCQHTVEANKEIGLNCVFAGAARWVSVYTTIFHIECVCVRRLLIYCTLNNSTTLMWHSFIHSAECLPGRKYLLFFVVAAVCVLLSFYGEVEWDGTFG